MNSRIDRMTNVIYLFFELMQVAIETRSSLSRVPTQEEWQALLELCKRHTLVGIGYVAINKLPKEQWPPSNIIMLFTCMAEKINTKNRLLNEACCRISKDFANDGLFAVILKGQSNCLNYPENLRAYRTPGDIDVWTIPKEHESHKAVIEYVQKLHRIAGSTKRPNIRYHHIDAPPLDGIPVEVHFRPSYRNSPIRNWKSQRWYATHADMCVKNMSRAGFNTLTSSINLVYLMEHLYRHLLVSGIGLRQFMDYYFALHIWHNDVLERNDLQSQGMWTEGLGAPIMSREEVMRVLRSFGMGKFAAAAMWVLHEVFAMPAHYYICEPDERRGRQLLDEIMLAGNFGQYDERGRDMKNGGMVRHGLWKLKRVMRLVRNYPEEALCEPLFRVWHLGWRLVRN